jgi:HTH-type transcriptional regulator / antitoxin MqsA
MKLREGMICPICEAGSLKAVTKDVLFEYRGHVHVVANVHACDCDVCGESLWGDGDEREFERALTDVRRRIDDLLTTVEIRAIRQQFGMTQVEFARALRVGEKNFARYENGQATQGRSTDNLLRILQAYPDALQVIYRDWSGWATLKQEITVSLRKRQQNTTTILVNAQGCQLEDEVSPYESAV